MKTVCFFGHRVVWEEKRVRAILCEKVEELARQGFSVFKVGIHGDFDKLALSACCEIRNTFPQMQIQVVLTSPCFLTKNKDGFSRVDGFEHFGVETMIYPIEDMHFKQQITQTNRMIVDDSDLVVCYVDYDARHSGAKNAVKYAFEQGKEVFNLYGQTAETEKLLKSYQEKHANDPKPDYSLYEKIKAEVERQKHSRK